MVSPKQRREKLGEKEKERKVKSKLEGIESDNNAVSKRPFAVGYVHRLPATAVAPTTMFVDLLVGGFSERAPSLGMGTGAAAI